MGKTLLSVNTGEPIFVFTESNVWIMGKTLLSVNAKIGSPVLLRQFQMTLACL